MRHRQPIEIRHLVLIGGVIATFLALAACGSSANGEADSGSQEGDTGIVVSGVWSRPVKLPEGDGNASVTGVVYLAIENQTNDADTLTQASSNVAEAVEIHETKIDNGVMQMRQVKGGLEIPGGESVVFEPGGYHIMLIDMKQDLNPGDTFDVELAFEHAGTMTITSEVREQ